MKKMKKLTIIVLIGIWGLSTIFAAETPGERVLKPLPEKNSVISSGREVSFEARSGGYFMEFPGVGAFGVSAY